MYDKSCQPGDHTLGNDNTGCPSAAKLPLDRSDCRHTQPIEEADTQKASCGNRSQNFGQLRGRAEQYGKCGDDTLLCHKSG